jgi:hypothetical protein
LYKIFGGPKKMKKIVSTFVCVLALATSVFAGAPAATQAAARRNSPQTRVPSTSTCGSNPILVADGTIIQDFVSANTTNYYFENFTGGHSYALEISDPFDTYHGVGAQLALLSSCLAGPTFTDVVSTDPDISSTFSDRISWIQPSSSGNQVSVANVDASNGYSYNIRLIDTTLFNPRWSSFNSFITQYGFLNNTGSALSGTLTVVDTSAGGTTHTLSFALPAGKVTFKVIGAGGSSDIVVPANHAGNASFAFVGPAGAIAADSYFINSTSTIIVPGIFAPKNMQH